jgi:hypothetical protein
MRIGSTLPPRARAVRRAARVPGVEREGEHAVVGEGGGRAAHRRAARARRDRVVDRREALPGKARVFAGVLDAEGDERGVEWRLDLQPLPRKQIGHHHRRRLHLRADVPLPQVLREQIWHLCSMVMAASDRHAVRLPHLICVGYGHGHRPPRPVSSSQSAR